MGNDERGEMGVRGECIVSFFLVISFSLTFGESLYSLTLSLSSSSNSAVPQGQTSSLVLHSVKIELVLCIFKKILYVKKEILL